MVIVWPPQRSPYSRVVTTKMDQHKSEYNRNMHAVTYFVQFSMRELNFHSLRVQASR